MFSITTFEQPDFVDVTLNYVSPTVSFSFNPENPERLPSTILDHGEYIGTTSNGNFSLKWTPNTITFSVAKYGDGEGGSLTVVVNNNPETMASFKKALNEWKAAVAY